MLAWWIKRKLDSFEKAYSYDTAYLREILAVSPRAALSYQRAIKLGHYRGGLSLESWHIVNIIGIVHEDCGACAQLSVDLALEAGVPSEVVRAVVRGDLDGIPEPSRMLADFALAVLRGEARADELREQVLERHGRDVLVAIAFALTTTKMYPTVKRVLGYAHSCTRVKVGQKWQVPGLLNKGSERASTAA